MGAKALSSSMQIRSKRADKVQAIAQAQQPAKIFLAKVGDYIEAIIGGQPSHDTEIRPGNGPQSPESGYLSLRRVRSQPMAHQKSLSCRGPIHQAM